MAPPDLLGSLVDKLGAWALAIPPVAGMLFSNGAVYITEHVRGPERRLPDGVKVLYAAATAGIGTYALWGLLFGWYGVTPVIVSVVAGIGSPGLWGLLLWVLRRKFPRKYAAAKNKRAEFVDDQSEPMRENDTTVWIRDPRIDR